MQAALPFIAQAVAPAVGNAFGAFAGNMASRAGTAGRNYDDVINAAKSSGLDMGELANRFAGEAQARSQGEMRFQQGVGMENQAFARGLNADQMRQNTYNNMAQNEQQNRANLAQSLMNDYANARASAANLMASTLRF